MGTGDYIRQSRKEAGYTQKELAAIIGVKATYISALERGVRRPGRKLLPLLCDALAVDELTLLYGPRVVHNRRSEVNFLIPLKSCRLLEKTVRTAPEFKQAADGL